MLNDFALEEDLTDNEASYAGLVSTIALSQGMLGIIIASCTAGVFQNELIDRYETALEPSIPSYRMKLNSSEPSLRAVLEELVNQYPELQEPDAPAVITITGATNLLSVKLKETEANSELDRFFGYLQWTREGLREFPYPIVLWVPPRILRQLSVKAPDFWSWRTGVFRFIAPVFTSTSAITDRTVPSPFYSDHPTALPIDELLEQVAQIEARNPRSPALATLYDRLGQAYEQRTTGDRADDRKQAIEYFQRSIQIPTARRSTQLNTLTRLGNLYRKLGDYNAAEALHLKCLDIETELGDRAGIASSWGVLGNIARDRGDYDKAETRYLKCLGIETELGDRAGIASSWGILGDIARNRGDYDKAETLYLQSLELRTELGDRAGVAISLGSLGDIARKQGDYEKAESLYLQSLDIKTKLGDRAGVATSWGLLGDIARNRGDYGKAESLYLQSLEIHTESESRAGVATALGVLGDVARERGDHDKAESLYLKCLDIETELGDRASIATSWGCLGENELGRKNFTIAETWFKKALPVMEELQMAWNIAETNWDLARLYRAKGDDPLAQEHYTKSHQLFTQLGAQKELEKIETAWNTQKP
jgi:tetratricopeptide (TPR) repeat protein